MSYPSSPPLVNNFAVIISSSRYWFNYRHSANALTIYRIIKRLGIPDENIILMNAYDVCDPRNPLPGRILTTNDKNNNDKTGENLYEYQESFNCSQNTGIQVDYRGNDVNVQNFIRVLTGRHDEHTPISKRLNSDRFSNILIYLSGHGGDEFFKFQDSEEISAQDIGYAIKEMEMKHRYREILFITDTCQAATLGHYISSPHVTVITSSKKGENSYAYEVNERLGVAIIDRFTYSLDEFFKNRFSILGNNNNNINNDNKVILNIKKKIKLKKGRKWWSLQDLIDSMDYNFLYSTVTVQTTPFTRQLHEVPVKDFFGGYKSIKISMHNESEVNNYFDSFNSMLLVDEMIKLYKFSSSNPSNNYDYNNELYKQEKNQPQKASKYKYNDNDNGDDHPFDDHDHGHGKRNHEEGVAESSDDKICISTTEKTCLHSSLHLHQQQQQQQQRYIDTHTHIISFFNNYPECGIFIFILMAGYFIRFCFSTFTSCRSNIINRHKK